MAETNDIQAHAMSLPYPKANSLHLLNGSRFGFNANQVYRMSADDWEAVKDNQSAMQDIVQWFVKDHYTNQLPRLITLERYYQNDDDIHYWDSDKASNRADNRIGSGLAAYITNIRVGYQFGNPLKFGFSDDKADDMLQAINDFNNKSDETYHEKVMGKNLNNTGRAYELIYIQENSNQPAMKPIDPANCFVVYDNTIEQHSLFAVRYFMTNFMDKTTYYIEVYTDNKIFYFKAGSSPFGNYEFQDVQDHYFNSVPITEYSLNDERVGVWENQLDEIDAYDKSLSEMTNSQEDFGNAILTISGDIDDGSEGDLLFDKDGNQLYNDDGTLARKPSRIDPTQRIMFLKPSRVDNYTTGSTTVIPTTAEYLTKELGSDGWELYNKRILADIHKNTNTPDVSDENFSANASGVAMSYKLWGADQERATQQSLYTRGIMRRLRLLATYWGFISAVADVDQINSVQITYTPNLPKNDAELTANLQILASTGDFSAETLHEYASPVTGVPAEQEKQRVDDERQSNTNDTSNLVTDALQKAGVSVDNNTTRETTDTTTSQSGQRNG